MSPLVKVADGLVCIGEASMEVPLRSEKHFQGRRRVRGMTETVKI